VKEAARERYSVPTVADVLHIRRQKTNQRLTMRLSRMGEQGGCVPLFTRLVFGGGDREL
jgi:hypothetical protein